MKKISRRIASVYFGVMLLSSISASAQSEDPIWLIQANAQEESVGHGLPVLALGRSDWPHYRSGTPSEARGMQRIQAELMATHPQGWRFSALARSEAWIKANSDAVTAAALNASHTDPAVSQNFKLSARAQSWRGEGIKLGSPWVALGGNPQWQWQADAQLLRLTDLRVSAADGTLQYNGGGSYDFDLRTLRVGRQITGMFLPPSGASGVGSSLSVALQGQPAPGWQVQLRADDLWSQLRWGALASEAGVLNSQITTRAADGTLDYQAPYSGQQAVKRETRRIGIHWQAKVRWTDAADAPQASAWTARADRKAGLNQLWLGRDGGDTSGLHWSVAVEPRWPAVSLGVAWAGWSATLATDGQGTGSEYRHLHLGWQTQF